jgi:hypothetical protein
MLTNGYQPASKKAKIDLQILYTVLARLQNLSEIKPNKLARVTITYQEEKM